MSENLPELLRANDARALLNLDPHTFYVLARAHPEMCVCLPPLKRRRYRKAVILMMLSKENTSAE